ncbi:MAG: ammonia-forming cytochrome c nitrite reductase subunit c552 [Flavobacteriaceae bacterium]|jgi:formate-dependent nitrite reductase cytochrome c552 subunit|nr:ammonia-forming cytochrome c nitrite reductase subunit c552 [Flavobacteriaceae bacterium]
MKKINLFKSLLALAISLTLAHCTSEDPIPGPAGTQGTAGTNGTNGTNGLAGANGDNICLRCHNADFRVIQPATFALTPKKGSLLRGTTYCKNCHTDDGYKLYAAKGFTNMKDISGPDGIVGITCTTCHSGGHGSAAAAISGVDAALRNGSSAVVFTEQWVAGTSDIIDFKNNSNTCVTCHQPRDPYRTQITTNPDGTINIITSRPGPHYGTQTVLLEGFFAHEISGTVAYPAKGSGAHRKGASCVKCHMGAASTDKLSGNHSFKPVLDNCKTCHTGAGVINYDINGGQTKIKNLMKDLAKEINRVAPLWTLDVDGALVVPSSQTSRNNMKDVVAKAIWNYRMLYYDHTYGLHNPKYAEALLKNTIAALKLLP